MAYLLKSNYFEKIRPLLMEKFYYSNIHQVPKIEKVMVSCGIGDAARNAMGLETAMIDLSSIAGQRPFKTSARNSIATSKIRDQQQHNIAVTLRGNVMYSFLDWLINLGLPRTSLFQGVNPNSFDGHGKYRIGIRDQCVFPEIMFDALGNPMRMNVWISTTAKTYEEGQTLLALLGMPFGKSNIAAVLPLKKKLKKHHFDSKSKGRRMHPHV